MFSKRTVFQPRTTIILVVVGLLVCAYGYPTVQDELDTGNGDREVVVEMGYHEVVGESSSEQDVAVSSPAPEEEHQRFKRATCDLTSGTNLGSSACAAHCLLKGYKGGYCNEKLVCVCR